MTMQYDVRQAHINQSGILVPYSTRVKAVAFVGTATAGQFVIFDTTTNLLLRTKCCNNLYATILDTATYHTIYTN